MADRTCLYCTTTFTDPRQKVCHGEECRRRYRREIYFRTSGRDTPDPVCKFCGRGLRNAKAQQCGAPECSRKYKAEYVREQKRAVKRQTWSPRDCLTCGEAIPITRRSDAEYCSRRCIDQGRSDRTEWRATYRPRQTALQREWRKRNPILLVGYRAKLRAPGLDPSQYVLQRDWESTLRRWSHCCAYCGESGSLTVDHVVPLVRGGRHTIGNLLPACRSCNARKHRRLIMEWRLERRVPRAVAA